MCAALAWSPANLHSCTPRASLEDHLRSCQTLRGASRCCLTHFLNLLLTEALPGRRRLGPRDQVARSPACHPHQAYQMTWRTFLEVYMKARQLQAQIPWRGSPRLLDCLVPAAWPWGRMRLVLDLVTFRDFLQASLSQSSLAADTRVHQTVTSRGRPRGSGRSSMRALMALLPTELDWLLLRLYRARRWSCLRISLSPYGPSCEEAPPGAFT